jgi:YVTN family beta-propeller protein
MKRNIFLIVMIILAIFTNCEEGGPVNEASGPIYLKGNGVYIINEGNYTWGNGSLSFYSIDSAKIYNNIFQQINERPLGDVPNSMTIFGDKAYIVVNNSGKIEVIENKTLKSKATISGFNSPRIIKIISNAKAYVSSLYSDSVVIVNPLTNIISGYINIRRSSESIELSGNKAFIANWSGGKEIIVINTQNNKVTDSIMVANEPESMVIDKNARLWVLCTGGYFNKQFPELIKINTITNQIEQRFIFPDKYSYPTNLQINGKKDMLVWLDNGVTKMDISERVLPSSVFIPQKRNYFYKMGINPVSDEIYVTDAVDYQKKGKVFRYDSGGLLIDSVIADIIPSSLCFKEPGK